MQGWHGGIPGGPGRASFKNSESEQPSNLPPKTSPLRPAEFPSEGQIEDGPFQKRLR